MPGYGEYIEGTERIIDKLQGLAKQFREDPHGYIQKRHLVETFEELAIVFDRQKEAFLPILAWVESQSENNTGLEDKIAKAIPEEPSTS